MTLNDENTDTTNRDGGHRISEVGTHCKGIKSKVQAKFKIPEEATNEFIHSDDRRNRHGVSFKVCRNKEDGALVRPQLPPKCDDKEQVHSTMLNENNSELASMPRVYATKKVMDDYNGKHGKLYISELRLILYSCIDSVHNVLIVESDMHNQEAALKIRLLKRQNLMNRKRKADLSMTSESSSSSPSKLRTEYSS
jgi:hypothetical protein